MKKWTRVVSLFVGLTFIVSAFAGVVPASAAKYTFEVDTMSEAEATKLDGTSEKAKDKESSGKAWTHEEKCTIMVE